MARVPSKRDAAVATEPMEDEDDGGGSGEGGMDVLTAMLIGCFVFVVLGIGFCFVQMKNQYDAGKDPALFYKGQDLNEERVRREKHLGTGGGGGEEAPAEAPAEKPADAPAEEAKPAEPADE